MFAGKDIKFMVAASLTAFVLMCMGVLLAAFHVMYYGITKTPEDIVLMAELFIGISFWFIHKKTYKAYKSMLRTLEIRGKDLDDDWNIIDKKEVKADEQPKE